MKKRFHIVFKTNKEDYYSTGVTYAVDNHVADHEQVANVMQQWHEEYPLEQCPNREFLILYPVQN